MHITWLGHSSWLIETDHAKILLDPFLTDNPKADRKPDSLHADLICVSHGHFDHVQDVAAIANRCQSTVVANYEIATWFAEKHGVQKTIGMNLGGWVQTPFARIKHTIAFHSSQLPDGSYGGNPGGYVLEVAGKRIYYAGDTAFFSDMQWIGDLGLDVAILPIGDLFTMGIDDSVAATRLLQPKFVLPTHYDTWPPIAQDAQLWAERIQRETDTEPVVLTVGQTWLVD